MICPVCHHHCNLAEGQTGRCGARRCENGRSVSVNYGQVTALALDPIEKKPLYRFHPGTYILSVGSFGCNMDCPFCQNTQISQAREGDLDTRAISPEELAETALSLVPQGNIGAAFTYNEPMVGFEYVRDATRLIKEQDMQTAIVTNGCVSQAALHEVLPYADAFNVDLKCFTAAGYRRLGGDLDMVKAFIETAAKAAHVEVTTLVVPGISDSETELDAMARWLAALDPEIPYHITRFFPCRNMLAERPTDPALLYRMHDIAANYLRYVYLGNL
ncbi:MAG TPA: AmmeMemoRadiSam system radical SAM enzyme [Candidatus Limiplasma sp.]|nr:AmmeMemoRadiSam system radical SAM enzyme [Candidatus Limiplasma sp.]